MKIGDLISVVDEDLEGRVVAVTKDEVTFTTKDGFDLCYPKDQLVVLTGQMAGLVVDKTQIQEKLENKKAAAPKRSTKRKSQVILEVDLHAEQLTRDYKRMQAFEILELQLDTAKRQIDFAIRKRIPKLVLIHGVGAGVLRAELEFLLKRYENLKFQDADYQKYGMGAIEVYFLQNRA